MTPPACRALPPLPPLGPPLLHLRHPPPTPRSVPRVLAWPQQVLVPFRRGPSALSLSLALSFSPSSRLPSKTEDTRASHTYQHRMVIPSISIYDYPGDNLLIFIFIIGAGLDSPARVYP